MKSLIIATGNTHKVEEFDQLLVGSGFALSSAKVCGGMPDVVEDGESFAANAEIKARALRALAPDDAWILSDDSGLEVDALHGAPGIYSARYAGEHASDLDNLNKLLRALEDTPLPERTARFRCVLCLINPQGRYQFFEGVCKGAISFAPGGDEGFGYDPVFIPAGYSNSFSELGETLKGRISHRAQAARRLVDFFSETPTKT
jgi:XTP/dITP diphosphohydrolase